MIVLLSPAKSLDFTSEIDHTYSQPRLLEKSQELVGVLAKKSSKSLQKLMSVSKNIADLNVERYRSFHLPFTPENAKQAVFAFNGDVYVDLQADTFENDEIDFLQKHLRILSGLYGLLKPLDLIQPYRLEMGTSLKVKRNKNLYDYWGDKITDLINEDIELNKEKVVLNLASNEYFKSVKKDKLNADIIDVDFKENRNGELKIISFNAKKARGRMAHLIVKEKITDADDLKSLTVNDYIYNDKLSSPDKMVFIK